MPPQNTKVWVKAPSIPSSSATLYVYYGNPSAANVENGDNVFEFFDDFENSSLNTSRWTATGSYSISGGKITITTGSVYTKNIVGSSPQNSTFEIKAKYTSK